MLRRFSPCQAFAAAILAFALHAPAAAQDVPVDPRFQLERHQDGFVRLDRDSGAVSFCRLVEERLSCRLSADERTALLDEIESLQAELQTLQEAIAGLPGDTERTQPPGAVEGGDGSEPEISQTEEMLDEEFERALDFTKRTMRRLFDVVKELQRDLNEG